MKTIGLIGGLSWLSTVEYYKLLNQMVNDRMGGVASAKILMYSVNFEEIKTLTVADDWNGIATIIGRAAKNLQMAGADCMLLGANTMHKIADEIQYQLDIPLIHIAAATAIEIKKQAINKVALLGTKYTMQLDFYKTKLADKGIETIIPGNEGVDYINNAIYNEMSRGDFLPTTKNKFNIIIEKLVKAGAEGIILACTEIPILLKAEVFEVPVFDTTYIHSKAAVDFVLS